MIINITIIIITIIKFVYVFILFYNFLYTFFITIIINLYIFFFFKYHALNCIGHKRIVSQKTYDGIAHAFCFVVLMSVTA